jgi:hypothetical protein
MGHLARSTPIVAAPNMMQQPAPPPPYSVHKQTPIGWAINDMPNGPPAPGNKKTTIPLILLKKLSMSLLTQRYLFIIIAYTFSPQHFIFPDEKNVCKS